MRIVFHGQNAASFSHGFTDLLGDPAEIRVLPDALESELEQLAYAEADAIKSIGPKSGIHFSGKSDATAKR
ncbi:hypothetical protein FQV39_22020 [Bosea sp. F3-2]|uniref:hypothetical protein n=1 Tax=Bosea sp. F3-2 TaxID=2599640 RepID=UPI0011F00EB6|nr:hypothetical protein [Bosea sp. F3-2]QEL24970.1 hypothetical protein FQV39_22020 [Bosea sp. F3-2]